LPESPPSNSIDIDQAHQMAVPFGEYHSATCDSAVQLTESRHLATTAGAASLGFGPLLERISPDEFTLVINQTTFQTSVVKAVI
jgi:hypothetical protein